MWKTNIIQKGFIMIIFKSTDVQFKPWENTL